MVSQFDNNGQIKKEIITRVCNGILEEFAPEELILVSEIVDIYLDQPIESLEKSSSSIQPVDDTPLGFGSDAELYTAIIAPLIISTLSQIITYFSDEKLTQALSIIRGDGKEKKGTKVDEVEIKVDETKQEITIRLLSHSLTRRKATIIRYRILLLIADELSK